MNYGSASGVNVDLIKGTAVGEGNDTLAGVENIEGDSERDVVIGNKAANVLTGNNGNMCCAGEAERQALRRERRRPPLGWTRRDTLIGRRRQRRAQRRPGPDTCYQNQGRGPVKACERPHHRTARPWSPTVPLPLGLMVPYVRAGPRP